MILILFVSVQSNAQSVEYFTADKVTIKENGRTTKDLAHYDIIKNVDKWGEYFVFYKQGEAILFGYLNVISKNDVNGGVMYFCTASITNEAVCILVRKGSITYFYATKSRGITDSLTFESSARFEIVH